MENYTKVLLYAYPLLNTVGQDYAEHIRNKALLSYDSALSTERLAEYLAEEILRKEKLEWLKKTIEGVLARLSDVERTLVAIRYFGKKKKIRRFVRGRNGEVSNMEKWSERTYFKRQQRLSEKVGAMLREAGLTKEKYLEEFSRMEMFQKIHCFIEEGRDRKISLDERRWLK